MSGVSIIVDTDTVYIIVIGKGWVGGGSGGGGGGGSDGDSGSSGGSGGGGRDFWRLNQFTRRRLFTMIIIVIAIYTRVCRFRQQPLAECFRSTVFFSTRLYALSLSSSLSLIYVRKRTRRWFFGGVGSVGVHNVGERPRGK